MRADGSLAGKLPAFAESRAELVRLYRAMVLTRAFDAKAVGLQRTGRLGTFPSSLGQEAVVVGVGAAMRPEDVLLPSFRELGTQLWRGVTLVEALGYWGGDERGSCFAGPREDFPICVPVGTQAPHAVGVALAFKLRDEPRVAVCVFGDGASSKGDVYEAMNLAGVWRLPVVFVINNNEWAISVPRSAQSAAETLAQKAVAAGFPGEQVDGNDVIAVRAVLERALGHARRECAPSLVEALTYRLSDHTTADDARRYRDDAEVSERWKAEPIARMRSFLIERGWWTKADEEGAPAGLCGRDRRGGRGLSRGAAGAACRHHRPPLRRAPGADGAAARGYRGGGAAMSEVNLVEAIRMALARAMEEDPNVLVLGEDVGRDGGVFRATDGLLAQFGAARVFDTPVSEALLAGLAVGLGAQRFRPVVEFQFEGFMYPAIDQLVCHAGRLRNRTRGRLSCPIVLRAPYGGGIKAPEHHSESPEAFYAHIPGIRVVIPSSPRTAYGLLLAAIRDPDPVVFLEPKRIYRAPKEPLEDDGEALPLDRCFVVREGRDLTLVSWGALLGETLEAADMLAGEGIEAAVIDVATLKPFDAETVLASVARTGRCVIAHEAPRTGGFGAEIAAVLAEEGLFSLLAPVQRVTAPDVPVPLPRLEPHYLPGTAAILAAARRAVSYR